jgi:hypothetical protein
MNNPPAFPVPSYVNASGETHDVSFKGMTLRDYFAAKAMQILMGKMHDHIFKTLKKSYETEDAIEMSKGMIVDTAYEWADAMMKARDE